MRWRTRFPFSMLPIPTDLRLIRTIPLEDPTHPDFKAGRIAFNNADFQVPSPFPVPVVILMVIPINCFGFWRHLLFGREPNHARSTMPVRGLRDTAPFHWDGIPGDPYGGTNSASVRKAVEPNVDLQDPVGATRHLVDGGMATTMKLDGG